MRLKVERLNDNGEGIGYIDGKIVFIPKVCPGDIVDVISSKDYKRYSYALIYNVLESNSKANCPYYGVCGGCQIMGLSYDKQLEYKKNKVINIFKKYNKMDINPFIIGGSRYGYRNKIILHVKDGKLGLILNGSHNIVNIDRCLLVSDSINKVISIINNNVNLTCVSKVMLRESTNNDIMVCFYGDVSIDDVINNLSNVVRSIYVNDKLVWGVSSVISFLGKYRYEVSPNSFFQVNYKGMLDIYNKVFDYVDKGSRVLDLYCGTGSIGIYVSSRASSVLGIEINKDAIRDANRNKELNKLNNIYFRCGNVDSVIDGYDNYDVVIVDPPRSGLNKKTINILLNIKSKKIIYVSCDPITLARDIRYLSDSYNLEDICLVDMFPNTYHVESVVLLSLKK